MVDKSFNVPVSCPLHGILQVNVSQSYPIRRLKARTCSNNAAEEDTTYSVLVPAVDLIDQHCSCTDMFRVLLKVL